jgi:cellulose synthase/poly-beta-1,6-N-acetylglucosamine synthase-like glycosyltransferase
MIQTKDTKIDIVIIGLNCEKTLEKCICSVLKIDYNMDFIDIYYVDGGFNDNSKKIAQKYSKVNIIELNLEYPTPGKQRNEGWLKGNSKYVQFIDSDTILDKNWLKKAVNEIKKDKKIGAICGNRKELYPEKSIFNWIGNLEWNLAYGEISEFGGDVLIKREVLEKTKGYNSNLVAGEDPELSHRIIKLGYKIVRINTDMTKHDLAMTTVKQYLKRAYRTGYAFAEVNFLHNEMWKTEVKRILKRGGISLGLISIGLLLILINKILAVSIILLGIYILFRPRLQLVKKFMYNLKLTKKESKLYCWHLSVIVLPQLIGVLRYYIGKILNKPLRNKKNKLSTGGIN